MFSSRYISFEKQTEGRRRNVATKRVTDTYLRKVARREKEEEEKRIAKEARESRTKDLQARFGEIKDENDKIKEDFGVRYDENGERIVEEEEKKEEVEKKEKKEKKDKKDKKKKKSSGGGFFSYFTKSSKPKEDVTVVTTAAASAASATAASTNQPLSASQE